MVYIEHIIYPLLNCVSNINKRPGASLVPLNAT